MADASVPASSSDRSTRELERLGAQQAILGDLIRLLAHDLNNPLQSITLLLELLDLDVQGEDAHERVRQCSESAALMRQLVRGLAEFARAIDEDERPSVDATLDRALDTLRRRLDRHGIELARDTGALSGRSLSAAVDANALRWAVTAALLGLIDVAANTRAKHRLLAVSAVESELRFELTAAHPDEPVPPLSDAHWQRAVAACVDSGVRVRADAGAIVIALPS